MESIRGDVIKEIRNRKQTSEAKTYLQDILLPVTRFPSIVSWDNLTAKEGEDPFEKARDILFTWVNKLNDSSFTKYYVGIATELNNAGEPLHIMEFADGFCTKYFNKFRKPRTPKVHI